MPVPLLEHHMMVDAVSGCKGFAFVAQTERFLLLANLASITFWVLKWFPLAGPWYRCYALFLLIRGSKRVDHVVHCCQANMLVPQLVRKLTVSCPVIQSSIQCAKNSPAA